MAESKDHGRLVAPNTKTPLSLALLTPYIWTKNSVFTLFEASFSPSLLAETKESISSIKIIADFLDLAIENKVLMVLADSPTYLEIKSEEETEKKVESA